MAYKPRTTGQKKSAAKARARQAKAAALANTAYNEVAAYDLKLLISQVASLTKNDEAEKEKPKVNAALDEAAAAQEEALKIEKEVAKEIAKAAEEELKRARERKKQLIEERKVAKAARKDAKLKAKVAPSAEEETAIEAVRLFEALLNSVGSSVSKKYYEFIAGYYDRAQQSVLALPADTQTRLSLFSKMLGLTAKFRRLSIEDKTVEEEQDKPPSKADEKKRKLLGTPDSEKKKPWKSLKSALRLLGRRGQADDNDEAATETRVPGAAVAAFVVKSISRVGNGLTAVGKAIKENGVNTLKWVSARLGMLTSKMLNLFRSARDRLGINDASDVFALGAIATGILPALVDGLVSELKAKFGDNWITGFIKENWDTTKRNITEWLSDLIEKTVAYLKTVPGKVAEGAESLWKKGKAGVASLTESVINYFKGYKSAPEIKQKPGSSAKDKLDGLIADHSQPNISTARKLEVEGKIRELVEATPSLRNDTQVVANLSKRGIFINSKVSRSSSVDNSATSSVNTSTSGGQLNVNTVVNNSAGAGRGHMVAIPPSDNKEEGPITAVKPTPPPPATSNTGADDDTGTTGRISGGLTNFTVPNQAAPDTLVLLNLSGMGIA